MKLHLRFIIIMGLFLSPFVGYATHTITPFANLNFCGSSYPTAYQNTVLFTLAESVATDFGSSQTNQTMILTLPAGFEFNTAAGPTVTRLGNRLTIVSAIWTTTAITVTLTTTANSNTQLNAIYFNNFQIRATVAGSGILLRTGGAFVVEGSADIPGDGNPNPAESFGYLYAGPQMVYNSSAVAQYSTANINRNCVSSTNPI